MKRFIKSFCSFGLVLLLILSLSITSFADVNDLIIGTDSNAVYTDSNAGIMTLELFDDDFGISTFSALGSVVNTVDLSKVFVTFETRDDSGVYWNKVHADSNGNVRFTAPYGRYISQYLISLEATLPVAGTYLFSADQYSEFSFDIFNIVLSTAKYTDNASPLYKSVDVSYVADSGEFYIPAFGMQLTNVGQFYFQVDCDDTLVNFDCTYSFNFTPSSGNYESTAGTDTSDSDYQSGVSSSLSDLSSSVGEMSEEISGVTEAIQNLQGAMEPHYSNVLTQLHHITEQLHAFYDQIYNNIHLKEYALWQDIKAAIENIDLEVNVNLDNLKTSIDNMSQAVQNKLQSTTDQITGGYDNSGLESDKSELDGVLNQYEQAEEDLFEDAKGNINDFEFDTPLDAFTGPLSDVSYFLSGLFNAMGPMNVIITFSLTLTIAMVMIGWYRFKGGR